AGRGRKSSRNLSESPHPPPSRRPRRASRSRPRRRALRSRRRALRSRRRANPRRTTGLTPDPTPLFPKPQNPHPMKTCSLYGFLSALAGALLLLALYFLGFHSDPAKLSAAKWIGMEE